ncbi:MAG: BCR family protein [SAR86 cluster bacterium]|jgi:ribosome maturation factor RimP|nr:BCR family protein [SAR86 cluster bacterium]MDG1949069.1 BCR family protein [SAR86 cluster bacterium]MDG2092312.1 BCR family protein [SAR86 cluster bacterium]|tara:strand:- start:715 stop:1197 length:483 start_codon:yes stop_codon:yes gene_type:complete
MNKDDIENIVNPVIGRHECYLWGIEILRGKRRPTLRIYIESHEGAGIEDCENVSRDLNYEVELESILGEDFVLEVSTPGIERRFFNFGQLNDYLGEDFKIKLREPLNGIKNISGCLTECKDQLITIETSDLEYKLEFGDMDFCKLEPNFEKIMKESEHAK